MRVGCAKAVSRWSTPGTHGRSDHSVQMAGKAPDASALRHEAGVWDRPGEGSVVSFNTVQESRAHVQPRAWSTGFGAPRADVVISRAVALYQAMWARELPFFILSRISETLSWRMCDTF